MTLESESKPEYIEKLKKIGKQEAIEIGKIENLRKRYGLFDFTYCLIRDLKNENIFRYHFLYHFIYVTVTWNSWSSKPK